MIGIRDAGPTDALAIASVHVAVRRDAYAGIVPDTAKALSVEASTAMWRAILDGQVATLVAAVLVVEDGARIVGFGAASEQRDEALAADGFSAEIGAIYVLASHQGRGVGRLLMATLSRRLIALGHDAISLWVFRANSAACAFYGHLGGQPVGERTSDATGGTMVELAYGWRDLSLLAAD